MNIAVVSRLRTLHGRARWGGLLSLVVAGVCSPAMAQEDPALVGRWDPPPGGSDWTHPDPDTENQLDRGTVHACHLATGQILVWPYHGFYARLWDPKDGSFTDAPSDSGLFCAGHAALADGSILVAGGGEGGRVFGRRPSSGYRGHRTARGNR